MKLPVRKKPRKQESSPFSSLIIPAILLLLLGGMVIGPKLFGKKDSGTVAQPAILPGGAPKPAAPDSAGRAVTAIRASALPGEEVRTVSFEFERSKAINESEKLAIWRSQYPLLRDQYPVVLTVSDYIMDSKAKETLVFPFKYKPTLLDGQEQLEFEAPTVSVLTKNLSEDFGFELTASIEPSGKKQSFHILILAASKSSNWDSLITRGFAEAKIKVSYPAIFAPALELPQGLPEKNRPVSDKDGTSFILPVLVWYNPCKTTEAELLKFDEALSQIADCYATQAQLQNAEFHERYWNNKKQLETFLDSRIQLKNVRFTNVPFTKEVLGAFENGWEGAGKAFQNENGFWQLNGQNLLLKDRYDLIDAFKDEYDEERAKLDWENKAVSSIGIAIKAAEKLSEFQGIKDSLSVNLFEKQARLFEAERLLLLDPFASDNQDEYAKAVADLYDGPEGTKIEVQIRNELSKKFGSGNIGFNPKLQAEIDRLSKLKEELESELKETDEWRRLLALKQPLSSLNAAPNGIGAEWAAVPGKKEELEEKIRILSKQTESISGLALALSRGDYSILSYHSEAMTNDSEEKRSEVLAAFDNPVVDREFRARRYLAEKYWLNDIDEAYAFYDLAHAVEEARDIEDARKALKNILAKPVGKTAESVIADAFFGKERDAIKQGASSPNYYRLILKDLEDGKIKQLLEKYKKDLSKETTLDAQSKALIEKMQSNGAVSKEFETLKIIAEKNNKLVAELAGFQGNGAASQKESAATIEKEKMKKLDSGLISWLYHQNLFWLYVQKVIGLEFDYGNVPLLKEDYDSLAFWAKATGAHYSKHMNNILQNPIGGYNNELKVSCGDYSLKTSDLYVTSYPANPANNQQGLFPGKKEEFFIGIIDEGFGCLKKFLKISYNAADNPSNTNQRIKLFKYYKGGYIEIRDVIVPAGDKKSLVRYPENPQAQFLFEIQIFAANANEARITDVTTDFFAFNNEIIEGFGKFFYDGFKSIQSKAKPENSSINFFGITYAEPIADLSLEANKDLVAGYAGLLAKDASDGIPKYSKAPQRKLAILGKTLRQTLQQLLFEQSEFLPKELNPNALAQKIGEGITLLTIGIDSRWSDDATKRNNLAEPKLLALFGALQTGEPVDNALLDTIEKKTPKEICFGEENKVVQELAVCDDSVSDSLLNAIAVAPVDPVVENTAKTIALAIKPKPNVESKNPKECSPEGKCIVNASDCADAGKVSQKCIVVLDMTNFFFGKQNKDKKLLEIEKIYLSKQTEFGIVNANLETNGDRLLLGYSNTESMELKKIKIGSNGQEFALPVQTIVFDFQEDNPSKSYRIASSQGNIIIYLVKPIPVSFVVSGGKNLNELDGVLAPLRKEKKESERK